MARRNPLDDFDTSRSRPDYWKGRARHLRSIHEEYNRRRRSVGKPPYHSIDTERYAAYHRDARMVLAPRVVAQLKRALSRHKTKFQIIWLDTTDGEEIHFPSSDVYSDREITDTTPKDTVRVGVGATALDPMTAWMICHRIGHALLAPAFHDRGVIPVGFVATREKYALWERTSRRYWDFFRSLVPDVFDGKYDRIFTFKSAREGGVLGIEEGCIDSFSQYLHDGKIRLLSGTKVRDRADSERMINKLAADLIRNCKGGFFMDRVPR